MSKGTTDSLDDEAHGSGWKWEWVSTAAFSLPAHVRLVLWWTWQYKVNLDFRRFSFLTTDMEHSASNPTAIYQNFKQGHGQTSLSHTEERQNFLDRSPAQEWWPSTNGGISWIKGIYRKSCIGNHAMLLEEELQLKGKGDDDDKLIIIMMMRF